jgi:hypothetical protein
MRERRKIGGRKGGTWGERRDVYAVSIGASGHGLVIVWRVHEAVYVAREGVGGHRTVWCNSLASAMHVAEVLAVAFRDLGWDGLRAICCAL